MAPGEKKPCKEFFRKLEKFRRFNLDYLKSVEGTTASEKEEKNKSDFSRVK